MVMVIDTEKTRIFRMSLVMAMPVKRKFVAQFFSSTKVFREKVVNFHLISILKKESTPSALPLLFLEK